MQLVFNHPGQGSCNGTQSEAHRFFQCLDENLKHSTGIRLSCWSRSPVCWGFPPPLFFSSFSEALAAALYCFCWQSWRYLCLRERYHLLFKRKNSHENALNFKTEFTIANQILNPDPPGLNCTRANWHPERVCGNRAGQAQGLVKLWSTSGDSGVRKRSRRARHHTGSCWEPTMLGTPGSAAPPAALGLPRYQEKQVCIAVTETGIQVVSAAFAIITVTLEMLFSRLNFRFRTLGSILTIEMVTNELCLKKVIFFL